MSSPHVSKRRKFEDSNEEAGSLTRSEDFWFEDGNLYIRAESTEFRIHRSVLTRQSTHFQNLLSSSNSGGQGGSALYLHDSADDIWELLNALYDGFQFLTDWRDNEAKLSTSTIFSLVRLGQKYHFTGLRDEAAKCLNEEYPADLEAWLAYSRGDYKSIQPPDDVEIATILFQVLMLAKDCKIPTIMPSVYLDIYAFVDQTQLIEGVTDTDGVKHRLPSEILVTCLSGFNTLQEKIHKTTYEWLSTLPAPACPDYNLAADQDVECLRGAQKLFMELFGPESEKRHGLEEWDEDWEEELCEACATRAKSIHNAGRENLWDMLPSFFGLGEWDDLSDF